MVLMGFSWIAPKMWFALNILPNPFVKLKMKLGYPNRRFWDTKARGSTTAFRSCLLASVIP